MGMVGGGGSCHRGYAPVFLGCSAQLVPLQPGLSGGVGVDQGEADAHHLT